MLNTDGVIQGNHRTDLAGVDMNRQWQSPSPFIHPVMYAVRDLASRVSEERPIDAFCDIHGHFLPHGDFMFYCDDDSSNRSPTRR